MGCIQTKSNPLHLIWISFDNYGKILGYTINQEIEGPYPTTQHPKSDTYFFQ